MEIVNTYLSFQIENEYFAVNVSKVLEVLQKQKITRVPNAVKDIRGVTNFRGEIIPVFETRSRFGLPDRPIDDKFVIIVLEITKNDTKTIIGAIADRVRDVINIQDKDLLAVPKMGNRLKEELLLAIYKLKEEFIMLLDVDKMFLEKEIKALPEAIQNE